MNPRVGAWQWGEYHLAQTAFETAVRQLERTIATSQALLAAVAISGSLAGPLLIVGITNDFEARMLAASILVYLVFAAAAVSKCLSVLYTPQGDDPSHGPKSQLHYRHIIKHGSMTDYANKVSLMSDEEQLRALLADVYVISTIIKFTVASIRWAIRWTAASFVVLGAMVAFRAIMRALA